MFINKLTQSKKSTKIKHTFKYILTICFLLVTINARADKPTFSNWDNNPIGQGFAFANIGNETSMAMMLSYTVTNANDSGAGLLRQAPILDQVNLVYDGVNNKVIVPFTDDSAPVIDVASTVVVSPFELQNNAVSVSISGVSIVGDVIEITPSAPLDIAQTMTLTYASLNTGVDTAIYDSNSLPAQPFYEATIVVDQSAILAEVLEDSASPGGANNTNGVAVTAVELAAIIGITGVNLGNEAAYQVAIAAETSFSNPPTVAEVQAIIDAVNASNVIYDFELDTIGNPPANVTAANGTVTTGNHSTEGQAMEPLTAASGNSAAFNMNLFPSATNYSVTWKETYTTAGRSGFTLRAFGANAIAPGIQQGYLFKASPSAGHARIYTSNASGYTQLSSTNLTASGIYTPRWYRATVEGSTLTFEYSDDGVTFVQITSITDTTYPSGGTTQFTRGYGEPVSGSYFYDIIHTLNPSEIASSEALAEVLEDSASSGGANNANGIAVTEAELAAIIGITGVDSANEAAYQSAIAAETSFQVLCLKVNKITC